MLRDSSVHDFWKVQRFPQSMLLTQQFDNHIGLCGPSALPAWLESQLFLSWRSGVVAPEPAHNSRPFSRLVAIRVSGSDKSRSPVARKRRRSALYVSGATRLA